MTFLRGQCESSDWTLHFYLYRFRAHLHGRWRLFFWRRRTPSVPKEVHRFRIGLTGMTTRASCLSEQVLAVVEMQPKWGHEIGACSHGISWRDMCRKYKDEGRETFRKISRKSISRKSSQNRGWRNHQRQGPSQNMVLVTKLKFNASQPCIHLLQPPAGKDANKVEQSNHLGLLVEHLRSLQRGTDEDEDRRSTQRTQTQRWLSTRLFTMPVHS